MIGCFKKYGWDIYYDPEKKIFVAEKTTRQLPETTRRILEKYGIEVPVKIVSWIETRRINLDKEKCDGAFKTLEELVEAVKINVLEVVEYALIMLSVETIISYIDGLDKEVLSSKNIERKVRTMLKFVDGTILVSSGIVDSKPVISIYVSWSDDKHDYFVDVVFGLERER